MSSHGGRGLDVTCACCRVGAVVLRFNFAPTLSHRVVDVRWLPTTPEEWAAYTAARGESARLWAKLVAMHAVVRRMNLPWPSRGQWEAWARGRFPALSAQSVQQVVAEFLEAVESARASRASQAKAGLEATARYPWKTHARFRDVPYTNQDAVIHDGVLRLSNGRGGTAPFVIRLPKDRPLPGRLMEVQLGYGVIRLVCEVRGAVTRADGPLVGVDLGVNTLLAATDGQTAIVVSGREVKATVQYRNKSNAELRSRIDRAKPGSKRRKKLVRARYAMSDKIDRKVRDALHKATRAVAAAFPRSAAVVGKPFNDAARKMGRRQAQQVSQASNARMIAMLAYKMAGGAEQKPEPYSSQTCPVCGCRQICRRTYQCKECGLKAPRDVVGCVNIRAIGKYGGLRTKQPMPTRVTFIRPLRKYPVAARRAAGSSGGTPARVAA